MNIGRYYSAAYGIVNLVMNSIHGFTDESSPSWMM